MEEKISTLSNYEPRKVVHKEEIEEELVNIEETKPKEPSYKTETNILYNIYAFVYNYAAAITCVFALVSAIYFTGYSTPERILVKTKVINKYKPIRNGNTDFILVLENMKNNKTFELDVTISTWDGVKKGEILYFKILNTKAKEELPDELKKLKSKMGYKTILFLILAFISFIFAYFRDYTEGDDWIKNKEYKPFIKRIEI